MRIHKQQRPLLHDVRYVFNVLRLGHLVLTLDDPDKLAQKAADAFQLIEDIDEG